MSSSPSKSLRALGVPGLWRSRTCRVLISAGTVASLAVMTAPGASAAGSTPTSPQAQSVGNFLDATLGGNPLDQIAKLKYATAKAPGTASDQNPLDVTALDAINLPLTGALQLPGLGDAIHLGAANQVASANVNGKSLGASGLVNDSGAISVGGADGSSAPAAATLDLSPDALTGASPVPIPIPGGGSAAALGGVKLSIGAVSANAQTPVGYGKPATTAYNVAGVDLELGSPLLGGILGQVTDTLAGVVGPVVDQLTGALSGPLSGLLPADCKLGALLDPASTALSDPISLINGAVVIDPSNAKITISVGKLLQTLLQKNLNDLPPNTDLLAFVLSYLSDPDGLSAGLQGVINGLLDPLTAEFDKCTAAINAIPGVGPVLTGLLSTLTSGKDTLESTITDLVGSLVGAAGANPLAPLADVLKSLVDIGINVQPNGPAGPSEAAFVSGLDATPKQGTDVVDGQTVVRAIEVNVAAGAGAGLPGLPALPDLMPAAAVGPLAAAPSGSGILTLALANAAVGPSFAPAAPTSPAPPASSTPAPPATSAPPASEPPTTPDTNIPTGVDAGKAIHGSPLAPVILLLAGLLMAGAGAVAYRFRMGRHGA